MVDLTGKPKTVYFGYCGPIDSAGVTKLASALNFAVNEQFDEVYLCFSSGGGYVGDGIYLYHHIRSLPLHVKIHNTGTVASIATTIFVAGSARICCPNSIFMIHPVHVNGGGMMASTALRASLDAAERDETRIDSILRERTSISEDELVRRRSSDIYMTANDALACGLVSEIAEFTLPAGNKIVQI